VLLLSPEIGLETPLLFKNFLVYAIKIFSYNINYLA